MIIILTKYLFEIIDSENEEHNGKIYFFSTPHGFKEIGQTGIIYDIFSNYAVPIGIGIYLGEEQFSDEIEINSRLTRVINEKWEDDKVINGYNKFIDKNEEKSIIELNVCFILLDNECDLGTEGEIIEISINSIIDIFKINSIENEYGIFNLYNFRIRVETEYQDIYRIIDVYGHFPNEILEKMIINYFENLFKKC